MKHYKSERLKKLEAELNDLQEWLKLGLVPKREVEKHKIEIQEVTDRIEEEKERIQFLKESGETEEYTTPKKSQPARTAYTEMPSLPDVEMTETVRGGESLFGGESEADQGNTVVEDEDEASHIEDDDDESYFSDRNRWKRGREIIDPDANEW